MPKIYHREGLHVKPGGPFNIKKKRLLDAIGTNCPYCGWEMHLGDWRRIPTRDHIATRTKCLKNGNFSKRAKRRGPRMIVVVCYECNQSRKNYRIEEWLRRLEEGRDRRAKYVSAFIEQQGICQ